jgi:two-component system, NarL family, sensor histidine kinase DevS
MPHPHEKAESISAAAALADSSIADTALRSVVDAAPDGIVVVDETGAIVFCNPMIEHMFEYRIEELIGVSVDRLLPLERQRSHAALRASYLEHPRTRAMGSGLDLHGRKRSGVEFPVEISLSPVLTGERPLVIAIVRDITERRESDAELERARAELALVDERERIARDLHDTVIQRLFAVGLSLQAALGRADAGPTAERMSSAIDDIDDTIRDIRSAIFALHTRRPGAASLRDDVIAIAHEAARALGFEPAIAFDGPIDSAASDAMQEHLVSTLREALSNVAKHAGAARVEVDVVIDHSHLVLLVVDDGRGIGAGAGAGNGNGLDNMRERAEGLGGRFSVSAAPSGGTRVEWRVPIDDLTTTT